MSCRLFPKSFYKSKLEGPEMLGQDLVARFRRRLRLWPNEDIIPRDLVTGESIHWAVIDVCIFYSSRSI
jgi:hypothetical protein